MIHGTHASGSQASWVMELFDGMIAASRAAALRGSDHGHTCATVEWPSIGVLGVLVDKADWLVGGKTQSAAALPASPRTLLWRRVKGISDIL